jgi:uncharacterized protein
MTTTVLVLRLLAIVAGAYAAFAALLYFFQRAIIYYPEKERPNAVASGVAEMAEISLKTSDGQTLGAWYKKAGAGRASVVFFHGNAGNRGDCVQKARLFMDQGFGFLVFDYRGYGGNAGSPSEEGLYMDGRAALDFLKNQGVEAAGTVLYGESLGSGVVVQMALENALNDEPFAAVVLEAPYSAIADIAAQKYPLFPARLLVRDHFDSSAKIARIKSPLFVVHGEKDETIPIEFGRKLFAHAIEPKEALWLPEAGHVDLLDYGAGEGIFRFLEKTLPIPPS